MQEKIDKYKHIGFEIDPDWECNGYIYLLTDYQGEILYVGQTMNYDSRIKQHIANREMKFYFSYVKKLDSRYLLIQETILINKFKPVKNKLGFVPARIDHKTAYKLVKRLANHQFVDKELYIRLNEEILGGYNSKDYISYEEMIALSVGVVKDEGDEFCYKDLVY